MVLPAAALCAALAIGVAGCGARDDAGPVGKTIETPPHGRFAWMLWSHKVCRWLMPWAAGLAVLALGALALSSEPARWLAAAVAGVHAQELARA